MCGLTGERARHELGSRGHDTNLSPFLIPGRESPDFSSPRNELRAKNNEFSARAQHVAQIWKKDAQEKDRKGDI